MTGGVSSVFSLLGRIVWGLLCDVLTFKPVMLASSGLLTVLMLTWESTSHGGQVMFLIWVWAMFFSFSGTYAIAIAGIVQYLGQEVAGPVYGVIFTRGSFLTPLMLGCFYFRACLLW